MTKMNTPVVSVIIPCYNAEEYFNEAIDSIINQTYRNLEIILIDDGSTDRTHELILKYAESDPRIRVVLNEQNLGLIRTLNKGIDLAQGEYIARMDADDVSVLDRIEKLMQVFADHPHCQVASAGYCFITPTGNEIQTFIPSVLNTIPLRFVSFFRTPILHACVVCKASVFKGEKFDLNFIHSEDYEIFSRLLLKGIHFRNLPEMLYKIRMNPQSVSYRFESVQKETHLLISRRNIISYYGSCPDEKILRILVNRINFQVLSTQLTEAMNDLLEYRKIFIARENPGSSDMKELNVFLDHHRIDIMIQALKHAVTSERLKMVLQIMSYTGIVFKSHSLKYLSGKIFMRAKAR